MEIISPSPGLMIWISFWIATIILWIVAITRIIRSDHKDRGTRLSWLLIIIAAPILGAILYFAIGRPNRLRY